MIKKNEIFFIAEIGDKTQVATIALAANYQDIVMVTLGTTIGMLLANIPVVYAGEAMLKIIPLKVARWVASLVFMIIGLSIMPW